MRTVLLLAMITVSEATIGVFAKRVDVIVSPVVAATFGWLVFGEVPGTGVIVGGGILLASGARLSREMARRRAEAGAG